ncbi:MAG TPA: M56 family metallopeptidase, partial [Thermoanaerobaculia bacterium]|nr:M56 family metallopeptidase [Thermoanaerobaculia bacterium]
MTSLFEFAARLQAAGSGEITLMLILKATLILAIARLLLVALTRASAATKHVIATAALCAIVAMPFFSALLPSWNVALFGGTQQQQSSKTIGATGDEETSGVTTLGTAITLARATGVSDRPFTFASRLMRVVKQSWQGLILLALAAGALLFFGQMLAGLLAVWLVARNAEEVTSDSELLELDRAHDHLALGRDVRLLRSHRISVPVVWGIRKPMLLLPADSVEWPVERLRVVLLHELAHLKRLDGVTLLITRLAAAAYWFHPLAWSLERAGRNQCERAC